MGLTLQSFRRLIVDGGGGSHSVNPYLATACSPAFLASSHSRLLAASVSVPRHGEHNFEHASPSHFDGLNSGSSIGGANLKNISPFGLA
jgi:hypothetical protein